MNHDFVGGFSFRSRINIFKLTPEEIEGIREEMGFNSSQPCCGNCKHIYFAPHDRCEYHQRFVDIYTVVA